MADELTAAPGQAPGPPRQGVSDPSPVVRIEGLHKRFGHVEVLKGIDGAVIVEATIGVDGVPTDVRVVASKPEGVFDAAASQAFSKWRFAPRVEAGVKVARRSRQRIDFRVER